MILNYNDNRVVEELIKRIDKDIKQVLSAKRYNHSVGVMKKAEELAKIHGENVNKAKLVGLAHDIAKEMSKEEKIKYAVNNDIEIDDIERENVGLLHGKIGAVLCRNRYGFTQDMQNAIKYHTTGNENMDTLAKILFVADKIEDGRKYKDPEKMRSLAKARKIAKENLNKAVVFQIDASLLFTVKKGELIHLDGIKTRNKIIAEFLTRA